MSSTQRVLQINNVEGKCNIITIILAQGQPGKLQLGGGCERAGVGGVGGVEEVGVRGCGELQIKEAFQPC